MEKNKHLPELPVGVFPFSCDYVSRNTFFMENKIDYIIGRVLSGNASPDDILALSDWLNASVQHKEEFRQLKGYWEAEVTFTRPTEPESSFAKVRAVIRKAGSLRTRKRKRLWVLSVAAGIALLFGFGAAFFKSATLPAPVLQRYTYVAGSQRSEVTLADGSRVLLNKHSRLTYADTYGMADRTVELEGEAYFEVTRDASRKFEVRMGDASVCVLGTVFTVCADKENGTVTTTLVEGSVRFRSPGQRVTLTPSQQLVFVRASQRLDIRMVDVEKETAWKDGLLKYASVPFVRLMAELQQAYGVEVRIENKRLAEPSVTVSGTFSENQSFEEILDIIARSLPVRWTKKNGVYWLR